MKCWTSSSRSQCVSLMSRLHWLDKKQFCTFMKSLVENRTVQFLLSFFHSYLGFCSDLGNPYSPNPINLPLSRKKSPSRPGPDISPLGYSNNFGETPGSGTKEGVQTEIISITFKKMVTKMMEQMTVITKPENISLHNEMRQFLAYIHHTHGNTFRLKLPVNDKWTFLSNWCYFRKVVVSGLLLSIPTVENYKVEGKYHNR